MKCELEESMFDYYDERAGEYEELYTLGAGPASIPEPEAYKEEVQILAGICAKLCTGRMIDIACGTGFWLPYYAPNCSEITLLDHSKRMLGKCRDKITRLRISDKCCVIQGDFFEKDLNAGSFDSALAGFFVSHLTRDKEADFFEKLRSILRAGGRFVVFESAWNEERAKTRDKEGRHLRKLNDGREFEIHKKYFEAHDVADIRERYGLECKVEHIGRVFIAFSGLWA